MASLTEHFRRREHHAALPFRADCPICREERMQGTAPRDDVVPASVQAGVLAAVLATSAVAPPASALAGPGGGKGGGQTQRGAGGQGHSNGGGQGSGGGGGHKGHGGGAPPVSKGPKSSPPPAADDSDRERSSSPSEAPEAISAPDPEPRVSHARPERRHSGSVATTPEKPAASPPRSSGDRGRDDRRPHNGKGDRGRRSGPDSPPAASGVAERADRLAGPLFKSSRADGRRTTRAADPVLERIEPRLAPTQRKVVQVERELTQELGRAPGEREIARRAGLEEHEVTDARQAIRKRVRKARQRLERGPTRTVAEQTSEKPSTYTVRSGDSLWSITEDELAKGASDAQVAAGVREVWSKNEERVASGDPDEILPGERLEL